MFSSRTRRENRQLRDRVDVLERQLRAARLDCGEERREKSQYFKLAERIGSDRVATTRELTRAKLSIAQQQSQLADWSSVAIAQAERHGRLIRAVVRYRAEIANLRRQTGVPDRAVDPARPTPELVRVTRERDEARALLRPMQDRLDALQRLTEAEDRRLSQHARAARQDIVAVAS